MKGDRSPDIEVLVLTYNRAHLIGATLESLLAQERPASRICVLDNGSTDTTSEVVSTFKVRGVELIRRQTNDARGAWSDLQNMAHGAWTMVFHDDDLVHPAYLLHVAAALAEEPEATVAVSAMRIYAHPEQAPWPRVRGEHRRTVVAKQLAACLYGGFPMPFCSAVYRTDIYKSTSLQFDIYGKIADRPFVIDAAKAGRAVVLLDPYIKYRSHVRQDSTDRSTGPFLPEVLALQRYYREILGESFFDTSGRVFLRRNYRNLMGEWARLDRCLNMSNDIKAFLRHAIEVGAASDRSLNIGRGYALVTEFPRRIERSFKKMLKRSLQPSVY